MNKTKGKLISPRTCFPSNDCLCLIFSYAYDRAQFEILQIKRLNQMAFEYFKEGSPSLGMIVRSPKKVIVNPHTVEEIIGRLQRWD